MTRTLVYVCALVAIPLAALAAGDQQVLAPQESNVYDSDLQKVKDEYAIRVVSHLHKLGLLLIVLFRLIKAEIISTGGLNS